MAGGICRGDGRLVVVEACFESWSEGRVYKKDGGGAVFAVTAVVEEFKSRDEFEFRRDPSDDR